MRVLGRPFLATALIRLVCGTLSYFGCYATTANTLTSTSDALQYNSLMSSSDTPLKSVSLHFPPLAYDPNLAGSTQLGLLREVYIQALNQHNLRVQSLFYPPSRMVKIIRDGDADMFSSDIRVAQQYHGAYHCNPQPIYYLALMLYQNSSMHKPLYKEPKSELKHARILVPKESEYIFARIIDPSNTLLPIVLPHNMSRMFSAQREAFMIDYKGRVQTSLTTLQPQFDIQQYQLGEAASVICIGKHINNSQAILAALYQTIRSYQNTAFLRDLEHKYQFTMQWQPALPNFSLPANLQQN